MRVVVAAAMLALLGGPAFAQQGGHVQRYGEEDKAKTQAEKNADKAAERAYKNSLGNIPDKGPSDPWGSVRSTDTAKTTSTTAAKPKKTRTGNVDAKQ